MSNLEKLEEMIIRQTNSYDDQIDETIDVEDEEIIAGDTDEVIEEDDDNECDEKCDEQDELLEILLNTREQGEMVEQLIKNQIEIKDSMIDKLHKELDYYKQGSADRFENQLMKAVIKVRKDMCRIMDSDKWDDMSLEDIKREYQYTMEDLTDLLEQQNVDPYQSIAGDSFDGAIHQPKIEITKDESLDKTIKESVSEGYKKGDKVLIPERVIVYQYRA